MRQLSLVRLTLVLGLTIAALTSVWAVPTPADKSFELARQYLTVGNTQQAIAEFQRFLTTFRDDDRQPRAAYLLGTLYQRAGNAAKALDAYDQAIAAATGDKNIALRADAHYQMAECYRALGNYEKASRSYANALQLNARMTADDAKAGYITDRMEMNVNAQYWLAESLYQLGREAEALKEYGKVLEIAPTHRLASWARYSIGLVQYHQQNYHDAIAALEQVPNDAKVFSAADDARVLLGLAHAGLAGTGTDADAEYAKAFDIWNGLLTTAATGAKQQAAIAIAQTYYARHDLAKAEAAYAQALTLLDPADQRALETRMQLAHLRFNSQRYDEAAQDYRTISETKKYPKLANEALFWLGNCNYQRGVAAKDPAAYRDAVATLTAFLGTAGDADARAPRAALLLAYCYEDLASAGEQGAHEKATAGFTQVINRWPESEQADQARIGIARLTQSMTPEQLRALASTLPTGAGNWDVTLELARKEFTAGRYDSAVTAARKVLQGKPAGDIMSQAAYLIGASLHKQGKTADAVSYFQQVITSTPKGELVPYAQRALVQAYLDLRNFTEARNAAQALMDLPLQAKTADERVNEQAERSIFLASAYLGAQQYDDARAIYRKIVTEYGTSPLAPNALMNIAWIAETQNDRNAAIATYQEFITRYPDHALVPDAFFQLGANLAKNGEYARAIEAFTNVPDTSKLADQAAYGIAWAYSDQKKADEAIAQFTRITEQFPQSPLAADSWFRLGEFKQASNEYAEAMRYYSRALDLCKDDAQTALIAYKLGASAYAVEEYGLAANAFGRVVANYPTSQYAADSLFWKAMAQEKQPTQAMAARDSYQQYLTKYPTGDYAADAAVGLGRAAMAAKQYAMARADLQKAFDVCAKFENDPDAKRADRAKSLSGEIQYTIAQSYLEEKDYAQALREFAVVSMFMYEPWYTQSRLQMARCYALQGDPASATKTLQQLIASAPDSDAAKQAPTLAKELGLQL